MRQYCVKAFTTDPFAGNPAGIVLLNSPLSKSKMQGIAFINGFPETVFLLQRPGQAQHHDIWWFTPQREVLNAGHATLAAQFVLSKLVHPPLPAITLHWHDHGTGQAQSSRFESRRSDTLVYGCAPVLALSKRAAEMLNVSEAYEAGLDVVLVLQDEAAVRAYQPPLSLLVTLPFRGLCITAPSDTHDYCSRFFAPAYGVAEDHVTASAHCYLATYWAHRLDKSSLEAIQCSTSPGTLKIGLTGQGIEIHGACRLFSTSEIHHDPTSPD